MIIWAFPNASAASCRNLRLPARLDRDPLHPDHLRLTLAAVPVQGFEQSRVGADELIRLAQRCLPTLESLLGKVGAAEAFQRGVVHHDHLCGRHPFERVPGRDVPNSALTKPVFSRTVRARS